MFPEKESDEVFEGHLTRLRALIRKRMAVYGAEEKALRVMLEGEQEEERKRDHEKRQKKEREKLLQRKREIDAMLFGGTFWSRVRVPNPRVKFFQPPQVGRVILLITCTQSDNARVTCSGQLHLNKFYQVCFMVH